MDKLNSYETLFVADVSVGDEAVNATVDKFTQLIADNAEVVETAKWGKRRLAYPINDLEEGYYVVVTYKSEPAFPAELERLFNIDETIMRSLTVRLEFDAAVKAAEKAAAAAEAAAKAEEASAAEAEEAPAEESAPADAE